MSAAHLDVYPDGQALALAVADWLTNQALATSERFAISLSGGSTPKVLYSLLATGSNRDRFPWTRTHLFWGDERFVPRDHKDSNYRMVREAMLDHVQIPPANVHGFPVDGTPEDAASRYEAELQSFYGAITLDPARPLFDVTFLGLGEDGHTASLFPGVAALEETRAWTAAVVGAKPEPRLTMTYPAIDSSRTVAFLVAGKDKKPMLDRLRAGDRALPAARVAPVGELRIFADRAAVDGT
jgi:6-phosphogluconolactonase